jgi:NAD(P) transhydrogenase subunit alpha
MSLTNAISGIALVGSIVIVGSSESTTTTVLGTIAIAASASNVIGGFLLTDRMLRMFRKRT